MENLLKFIEMTEKSQVSCSKFNWNNLETTASRERVQHAITIWARYSIDAKLSSHWVQFGSSAFALNFQLSDNIDKPSAVYAVGRRWRWKSSQEGELVILLVCIGELVSSLSDYKLQSLLKLSIERGERAVCMSLNELWTHLIAYYRTSSRSTSTTTLESINFQLDLCQSH